MCFIGVEVEQETSAPPPKKNPGSAPERAESPSIKITVLTFLVKKSKTQAFRDVDILKISEKS